MNVGETADRPWRECVDASTRRRGGTGDLVVVYAVLDAPKVVDVLILLISLSICIACRPGRRRPH